jgi:uncharacterized membrane protein YqgA involved in biofilm formation
MIGTWINVGAILLGALMGIATRVNLSAGTQQFLKVLLGVATTWFGLKLCWHGLASRDVKWFFYQLLVVLTAMVLGHLLGKICRIQSLFNRIGSLAKTKLEKASERGPNAGSDGFLAATILFCAAPLGIVGALEDGFQSYFAPLAIKAVMDGLAAFSFARMFGWTVLLSAVPLTAFLSLLTVLAWRAEPWLSAHEVIGVVHASAGLIITYVTLVIFEIRKVELANYLPSLVVAPVLMKLLRLIL